MRIHPINPRSPGSTRSLFTGLARVSRRALLLAGMAAWLGIGRAGAAEQKIVFIAGTPSHGPLQHEHRAGCLLLQKCLAGVPGLRTEVYTNGWPPSETAFNGAAAIVVYSDGGGGHPLLQGERLRTLAALMHQGVGLGCIHYAVEPTLEKGQTEFLDWIGGAFEIHHSVNPHWTARFKTLPEHPVTRGVEPFETNDEWYYHMRFREGMRGVTPILTALPSAKTLGREDGTHSGNPDVRAAIQRGEPQHVSWVAERAGGGRGFGFTGGHFHMGWKNNDQRRLVLNAILWIAHMEVPAGGVVSRVTDSDLLENLDLKEGQPQPARSTPGK